MSKMNIENKRVANSTLKSLQNVANLIQKTSNHTILEQ